MKYIDLLEQKKHIQEGLDRRIQAVFDHGRFILGPEVKELEERLSRYAAAGHCVACANGTDALQMALMALDIGPGDRVASPAFNYFATAEMTALLGATPVLFDVDKDTFNVSEPSLEKVLETKPKAVVVTSMFGQCPNLEKLMKICKAAGTYLIEDGAQSFGATVDGKRSCGITDISTTSFFPSKPLGCYGDGGAVFTNDAALAERLGRIRNHGQTKKYDHEEVGLNSRLDTLQAAVLLAKLEIFDQELEDRQKVAGWYNDAFGNIAPKIARGKTSAYAQYTITIENRDKVAANLAKEGIPTAVHYPKPVHKQSAMKNIETPASLENSEWLCEHVLSLPFHPYLSQDSAERVANTVLQALKV